MSQLEWIHIGRISKPIWQSQTELSRYGSCYAIISEELIEMILTWIFESDNWGDW